MQEEPGVLCSYGVLDDATSLHLSIPCSLLAAEQLLVNLFVR